MFSLFFYNCQNSNSSVKIARVENQYLYSHDLPVVQHNNDNDSLIFVQNFITNWALQKLLVDKAKFNFKNYPSYVDSLVNHYKESLLIHYYQQAIIKDYLDTIVSSNEVNLYYRSNIDNFKLKENIFKINYIKIRNVAPNINIVRNNFTSIEIDDIDNLEDYCLQFAEKFFLRDTNWVDESLLIKQIPQSEDLNKFFINHRFKYVNKIELEDDIYKYFVFIKEYQLKGSSSPIEYVYSMIEKIVLNKRKKDLLNNIENTIIDEAIENNNFEIL